MTELNAQPEASPAEELRATARLLRETASKATPVDQAGRWTAHPGGTVNGTTTVIYQAAAADDAEWIALMSPGVAEPLADLLDSIATVHEQPSCDAPETCNRCAEPDPVIIDSLRVVLELTGRTA